MSWIKQTSDGVELSLRVVPGGHRNRVEGILGDFLKVRLTAPPVEGKANKALLALFADVFKASRQQIELIGGETSRNKRIRIRGATIAEVERLLTGLH